MKRITLLTVVALVFSLFTVTAAIAGPGPDSREGAQVPDPITKQDRDQVQARSSDPDQDQEQTQEETQNQIREQAGDCSGDSSGTDCDPIREETRSEAHNRVMARFAEMIGDDGKSAEYRHMFQWVWTFVLGPLRVLFF